MGRRRKKRNTGVQFLLLKWTILSQIWMQGWQWISQEKLLISEASYLLNLMIKQMKNWNRKCWHLKTNKWSSQCAGSVWVKKSLEIHLFPLANALVPFPISTWNASGSGSKARNTKKRHLTLIPISGNNWSARSARILIQTLRSLKMEKKLLYWSIMCMKMLGLIWL